MFQKRRNREKIPGNHEESMKTIAIALTGILLGNLLALAPTEWPTDDIEWSPIDTGTADEPQVPQTSELARREWALGCAAVLTEKNHDSHTLLGGCPLTQTDKADKRRILSEGWGINSREDLFKTLEWIDREGHRVPFEETARLLSHVNQKRYQMLLRKADNLEVQNKLRIVRQNSKRLRSKSLYGWDYSRGICLCRWAYVAGFITEEEAWERIMPMALLLQERFDSWEDLGRNYLIGRQFWSYEETQKAGWEFEDAVQRLLDMQSSPWNRYPWKMSLREDKQQETGPQQEEPTDPEEEIDWEEGTDLVAAAR
jgi:hypothetical protein